MASTLTITGQNVWDLGATVVAAGMGENNDLIWFPLVSGSTGLQRDYTVVSPPSSPAGWLQWDTRLDVTDDRSNTIAFTVVADTQIIWISCYNYSRDHLPISGGFRFVPAQINIRVGGITNDTILVSAVSSLIDNSSTGYLQNDRIITWFFTNSADLTIETKAGKPIVFTPSPHYAVTAAYLAISSSIESFDEYAITVSIDDGYDDKRTPASIMFVANPEIKAVFSDVGTNYVRVYAYAAAGGSTDLDPTDTLMWGVYPTEGITVVNVNGGAYALDSNGYGLLSAATIVSAILVNTSNYENTYTISVTSTQLDDDYEIPTKFKPYLLLDTTTYLGCELELLSGVTPPTKYYQLKVYGYSPGLDVRFNLLDGQKLAFTNNSTDVGLIAYDAWGANEYKWYSGEGFQPSIDVTPLQLDITPSIAVGVPALCSYLIQVSALYSYLDDNGVLHQSVPANYITGINFQVPEWVGDDVFYPCFTINNELSTTTDVYRLVGETTNFTIRNSSTLPTNTVSGIYLFYIYDVDNIGVGGYSATLETFASLVTTLDTTRNVGIQLTAYNVYASDWSYPQTKIATEKFIHVVSRMPSAADFIVYPASAWDGLQWVSVLVPDETVVKGSTAWGHCHTQLFYLYNELTNFNMASDVYFWYVSGVEPYPLIGSNLSYIDVPSTTETSIHTVTVKISTNECPIELMPDYYYDDNSGDLVPYANFYNSSMYPSGFRDDIKMISFDGYGTSTALISYDPLGIDVDKLVLSGTGSLASYLPVAMGISNSYTWTVDTGYWRKEYIDVFPQKTVILTVDDTGAQETIFKFEPTYLQVGLDFATSFISKDPLVNDWCNTLYLTTTSSATAYPLTPAIYTSNKYVVTATNIVFENVVPSVPGLPTSWQYFIWKDVHGDHVVNTNTPYTTSYPDVENYTITLVSKFTSVSCGNYDESLDFTGIIGSMSTFTTYTTTVQRMLEHTEIKMPYRRDLCEMPPNEWVTSENINTRFTKLNDNLTYLDNISKQYDVPPTELYGWFGTLSAGDNRDRTHWHVNQVGLDYKFDSWQEAADGRVSNIRDCCVKVVSGIGSNIMFVSDCTSVHILSSDFRGTEISSISYKGIGDDFVDIRAVDLDSDNRIYMLDGPKNRVIVYSYNFDINKWTLLYNWGGLGGPGAHLKLRDPQDLYIDNFDNVWIADTGNYCIKKYTRTGSWLMTIPPEHFITEQASPLSMVLDDSSEYLHVLTTKYIIVFDREGKFVQKYLPQEMNDVSFRRIEDCKDGGFFYVLASDRIFKISQTGIFAGQFALTDWDAYNGIYHDAYRNLYVTSENCIIRYIDLLNVFNVKLEISTYLWPMSAIYVDKDEYVQDWVLNRSFARFWDNLEIYRRSIHGKPSYRTVAGVDIPVIRTFAPAEYVSFPWQKNQIYIGVNELVTAPVINRCVDQLFDCEDVLFDLLQ